MEKMEFDKDGRLKVPEKYKQKQIDFTKTIILTYEKEGWGDSIDCKFKIKVSETLSEEKIKELEEWVDEKIKIDLFITSIDLEKTTPNIWKLIISGHGKDNRCRWCRTFRTALETFCNKEDLMFKQESFCIFEE